MNISHIHWLGHASFLIEDAGALVYIDPWKLQPGAPQANLILITHAHYDHCSPDDVKIIRKPETIVVGTQDTLEKVGGRGIVVTPGVQIDAGRWKLETLPAYNLGRKYHPKENGWVGYIVTLSSGQRIYHTGDTDAIPEIVRAKADVVMLPCGGTYTMSGIEAGQVARSLNASVVIPMHWGDIVGSRGDAEAVRRAFEGTVILEPERIPKTPQHP